MKRVVMMGLVALAASLAPVAAAQAEGLGGNWVRPNGVVVRFSPCGGGFCATAVTGPNAGKSVGKMSPNGENKFKGSLTDPSAGKTYSGSAKLSGNSLSMQGCVAMVLCRSETWKRK